MGDTGEGLSTEEEEGEGAGGEGEGAGTEGEEVEGVKGAGGGGEDGLLEGGFGAAKDHRLDSALSNLTAVTDERVLERTAYETLPRCSTGSPATLP